MISRSLIVKRAYLFEELIKDLFLFLGSEILDENKSVSNDRYSEIDLIIFNKTQKFIIEIKYNSSPKFDKRNFDLTVEKLRHNSELTHIEKCCLFTLAKIDEIQKTEMMKHNIAIFIENKLKVW